MSKANLSVARAGFTYVEMNLCRFAAAQILANSLMFFDFGAHRRASQVVGVLGQKKSPSLWKGNIWVKELD
jgi:hypothetical protein